MNDSLRIKAGKPSEPKYFNLNNKSYSSTDQALEQLPMAERYPGLTVYIYGVEYWFDDECSMLIPKMPSAGIISATFTELLSLCNSGGLIPGRMYLLTDYQTTYNQPVTNIFTVSDVIEPLILTAVTNRKLANLCVSTIYPQDIVFYNIEDNTEGFTKGKIYRRIDTVCNNDLGTDWRHIFYRRWKIAAAGWILGNSYLPGNVVTNGVSIYVCISADHTLNNLSSGWIQLPSESTICTSVSPDGYSIKVDGIEFMLPCTAEFADYPALISTYATANSDIVMKSQTLDNNIIIGLTNYNIIFEAHNYGWTIVSNCHDLKIGSYNDNCIIFRQNRHLIIGGENTHLSITENNENIKIGDHNSYIFINSGINNLEIGNYNSNYIIAGFLSSDSIIPTGTDGSNKRNFNKRAKNYSGLVSQAGAAAPTISILQDDLLLIVSARTAAGTYTLTKTGAFPAGKTVPNKQEDYTDSAGNLYQMIYTSADVMTLKTYAAVNTSVLADGVLVNQFISIKIYA